MAKIGSIVFGFILVFLGIIVGLNLFNITNINIFFDGWWTLIIIIPSIINLIAGKHKIDGLVGLIVGVILLLICQKVIDIELVWKLSVPLAIIALGADLIVKNIGINKENDKIEK